MKFSFLSMLTILLISTPVMAEKPAWAGKGQPTAEQKEAHKSLTKEKEKMEDEHEDVKDKMKKSKKIKADKEFEDVRDDKVKEMEKETKGLEKQKTMKMEQERKELEQGSDKGKEARETHSKKWWKFW